MRSVPSGVCGHMLQCRTEGPLTRATGINTFSFRTSRAGNRTNARLHPRSVPAGDACWGLACSELVCRPADDKRTPADTRRVIFVRHGESEWNKVFNRGIDKGRTLIRIFLYPVLELLKYPPLRLEPLAGSDAIPGLLLTILTSTTHRSVTWGSISAKNSLHSYPTPPTTLT